MTKNVELATWVDQVQALTQADKVHWCDGSDAENEALTALTELSQTISDLRRALL